MKLRQTVLAKAKKINPRWIKHIVPFLACELDGLPKQRRAKSKHEKRLDLSEFQFCIVGEAHGFKEQYTVWRGTDDSCHTCENFARNLSSIEEDVTSANAYGEEKLIKNNKKEFAQTLANFYRHFLRVHVKAKIKVKGKKA